MSAAVDGLVLAAVELCLLVVVFVVVVVVIVPLHCYGWYARVPAME